MKICLIYSKDCRDHTNLQAPFLPLHWLWRGFYHPRDSGRGGGKLSPAFLEKSAAQVVETPAEGVAWGAPTTPERLVEKAGLFVDSWPPCWKSKGWCTMEGTFGDFRPRYSANSMLQLESGKTHPSLVIENRSSTVLVTSVSSSRKLRPKSWLSIYHDSMSSCMSSWLYVYHDSQNHDSMYRWFETRGAIFLYTRW